MIEGGFRKNIFETFYISKEVIDNPLINELKKFSKKIKKDGLIKDGSNAIFSIGFGKRVLINAKVKDYSNILKEELIEIADYDPVKNNMLLIGKNKPFLETPIHWMIHHARSDVRFIVQLDNKKILNENKGKFPETKNELKTCSIDMIKDIMGKIKDSKIVIIKNHGILFIGNSKKEIEKIIQKVKR